MMTLQRFDVRIFTGAKLTDAEAEKLCEETTKRPGNYFTG